MQTLVTSTNIAQCNHLTLRLGMKTDWSRFKINADDGRVEGTNVLQPELTLRYDSSEVNYNSATVRTFYSLLRQVIGGFLCKWAYSNRDHKVRKNQSPQIFISRSKMIQI